MYDKLTIPARQRGSWECIDLGIASARQNYWTLFMLFFVPAALLGIVAYIVFPDYRLWLPSTVIWWFKPVLERPILYYLSRTLFGEPMTVRKVLQAWPSLLKPGLLARLTYARLSPGRSFYMPLYVLEKQQGSAYRQRRDLINYNQGAHTWLTIIGIHIEFVLYLSALLLVFFFIPTEYFIGDVFDFTETESGAVISQTFMLISMAIFAPFYVAAGFMLYLNRRIKLEGWDIEINFHNLVKRLHKERIRSSATSQALASIAAVSMLLLCFSTPLNNSLYAAESTAQDSTDIISKDEAYERIYEISESEEIVETETKTGWRPIPKEGEQERQIDGSVLEVIAKILRFIAIVVMISVIIYLIYFYRDIFARIGGKKEPALQSESSLTPIAKRLQDLPDDFLQAAEQAWQQREYRSAMSLLYRGSLLELVKKGCKDILAASTENECLRSIKKFKSGAYYSELRDITLEWQQTAYAQRTTRSEVFQNLVRTVKTILLTTQSEPGSSPENEPQGQPA